MDRFVIDKERGIIPETSKSSDDFDVLDRFFDMNEGVVVVRDRFESLGSQDKVLLGVLLG